MHVTETPTKITPTHAHTMVKGGQKDILSLSILLQSCHVSCDRSCSLWRYLKPKDHLDLDHIVTPESTVKFEERETYAKQDLSNCQSGRP
jgi:hypothetical protein